MKAMLLSSIAVAAVLGGCERVDWNERIQSQLAMPACASISIAEIEHENVGALTDYHKILSVNAPADCIVRWRTALMASREYRCEGRPLACTRYGDVDRYDEGSATVRFVAANEVQVELFNT